jgi:misacylated tRNA(Ala) deacylase
MPTDCLFLRDAYLKHCSARVIGTGSRGIELDRTVFYPSSGGQPADSGTLATIGGVELTVISASYADRDKTIVTHQPASPNAPMIGEDVVVAIDWDVRYRRMRMHTALHLLTTILPYPVTGGSVGENESRLDFDIPQATLDKDEITRKLSEMIAADAPVTSCWITAAELEANPGLVKTMSAKPPMGTGRVRLIKIEGYDLQPCGGTHVRRTLEIGAVRVTHIENKGRQNRRVRLCWA